MKETFLKNYQSVQLRITPSPCELPSAGKMFSLYRNGTLNGEMFHSITPYHISMWDASEDVPIAEMDFFTVSMMSAGLLADELQVIDEVWGDVFDSLFQYDEEQEKWLATDVFQKAHGKVHSSNSLIFVERIFVETSFRQQDICSYLLTRLPELLRKAKYQAGNVYTHTIWALPLSDAARESLEEYQGMLPQKELTELFQKIKNTTYHYDADKDLHLFILNNFQANQKKVQENPVKTKKEKAPVPVAAVPVNS